MSLESKIVSLAQAIGSDIKSLLANQGSLAALNTAEKTSLVAALNEIHAAITNAAGINDAATGATTTWSSQKISTAISSAINALLDGAPTALDTLNEIAAAINDDANFAATLAAEVSKRVRYDAAQTLSPEQQAQARSNIGAAAANELSSLVSGLGSYDRDFASDYATAKA